MAAGRGKCVPAFLIFLGGNRVLMFLQDSLLLLILVVSGAATNGFAASVELSSESNSSGQANSPILQFAQELAGERGIRADIRHDGSDAYRFKVAADETIEVESGSERGVLYAVYDVLDGKTSGEDRRCGLRGFRVRHSPF
jgi:hypothetical protein